MYVQLRIPGGTPEYSNMTWFPHCGGQPLLKDVFVSCVGQIK